MIILDTNVVSAIMLEKPDPVVERWLNQQLGEAFWITTITVFEIRYGIETLMTGRRHRHLDDAFERALLDDFEDRILPIDEKAARAAASLAARRERDGRPRDVPDTLLAGIALSRNADLATGNVRHFDDLAIRVIDPWKPEVR